MQVTIGKEGLALTWQAEYPETTECVHCKGEARIGFVAHETDPEDISPSVCTLHPNEGKGSYWLHDSCTVAVYFCKDCLETSSLYNQA